jgi:hypothetical protein
VVHPRRRFVQHDEGRSRHHRARDPGAPLDPVGKRAGFGVQPAVQIQKRGQRGDLGLRRAAALPHREARRQQVLGNRQRRKKPHRLKGAHEAPPHPLIRQRGRDVSVADADRAGLRLLKAGKNIDEGGLPRPVGADQTKDFRGAQLQVDIVDHRQPPESDGHARRGQDMGHGVPFESGETAPGGEATGRANGRH